MSYWVLFFGITIGELFGGLILGWSGKEIAQSIYFTGMGILACYLFRRKLGGLL